MNKTYEYSVVALPQLIDLGSEGPALGKCFWEVAVGPQIEAGTGPALVQVDAKCSYHLRIGLITIKATPQHIVGAPVESHSVTQLIQSKDDDIGVVTTRMAIRMFDDACRKLGIERSLREP